MRDLLRAVVAQGGQVRAVRSLAVAILAFLPAVLAGAFPVAGRQVPQGAPDYTAQPFVLENKTAVLVFENDGTFTDTISFRVRVQSQAGVQQFGVLQFPYASATQTLDILYVRVVKPDKRVIETPAENALDMPAAITRQARFTATLRCSRLP